MKKNHLRCLTDTVLNTSLMYQLLLCNLVPGVPKNVKFQIIGDAIRATWTPPVDGNKNILHYKLRWYKTNEKPPQKQVMPLNASERQAFITDKLEKLTYYSVELVAVSDKGEGEPYVMDGLVVGYPDSKSNILEAMISVKR